MAELDGDRAKVLACRLKVLKGFSRYEDSAAEAVALLLVRWCRGATVADREWTPEDQAIEIIDEIVAESAERGEDWDTLGGVARLRTIFRERFENSPEHRCVSAPNPACPKCGGIGWIILERGGVSGADRCDCWAKTVDTSRPACPECQGKGSILVGTDRRRCPKCSTPERRKEEIRMVEAFDQARRPKRQPSPMSGDRRAQLQAAIDAEMMRQGRVTSAPGSSPDQLAIFQAQNNRRAS